MDGIINIGAFGILTALWVAFGAALVLDRSLVDKVWGTFRSWPLLLQGLVALLILPVVAGAWVWETRWTIYIRLFLVAGLAWVTIYTFFPRFPGT